MRGRTAWPGWWVLALGFLLAPAAAPAAAQTPADAATVPLWDGETADPPLADPGARLFNRFGGKPYPGVRLSLSYVTDLTHAGAGAFRLDTAPVIAAGDFGILSIGFSDRINEADVYQDARDLSRFAELALWVRNETGEAFTLKLELKDDRNQIAHRASRSWLLPSTPAWTRLAAPLSLPLAPPWQVEGDFDLTRSRVLTFVIEANQGAEVSGSLRLDDLVLVEPGGPVDPATAPALALVERLARREFDALWLQRDRQNGLVPSRSIHADQAGTNVLAALIQLLPGAVERGWVTRAAADSYLARVAATLDTVMNRPEVVHVPPRYLDRSTLARSGPEESSVDAAFLFLALYQYRHHPQTDAALGAVLQLVLDRFDFAAFSQTTPPAGWRLAYHHDTPCEATPPPCFTSGVYDGYSGEAWLISLAAHLSQTHPVPIATHYHSGVMRVRATMPGRTREFVVHSSPMYRAPFMQWLMSLFVKTDDRGKDTFPVTALATNPHANAVAYQREAHAYFAGLGRPTRLQPDAGDDCLVANSYQQYSAFLGTPGLYMPWSVGFSFLGEPAAAEAALRDHLAQGFHGPLGLSDSVNWPSAEVRPLCVRAGADFWNLGLSALALVQYRWGGNERLAALPAVRAALDLVFHGQGFHTLAPCRVLDTRPGSPLTSGTPRAVAVTDLCGVPATARAVALNLTAVGATGAGHVTLYAGHDPPNASVLNFAAGRARANNAVVALPPDETGTLRARAVIPGPGTVHLVVDVFGYFE